MKSKYNLYDIVYFISKCGTISDSFKTGKIIIIYEANDKIYYSVEGNNFYEDIEEQKIIQNHSLCKYDIGDVIFIRFPEEHWIMNCETKIVDRYWKSPTEFLYITEKRSFVPQELCFPVWEVGDLVIFNMNNKQAKIVDKKYFKDGEYTYLVEGEKGYYGGRSFQKIKK